MVYGHLLLALLSEGANGVQCNFFAYVKKHRVLTQQGVCVCVCVCVRARVCVRACVCVCVHESEYGSSKDTIRTSM